MLPEDFHIGIARFESPPLLWNWPKGSVYPMTTALSLTDLKGAGHIKPPNGISTTPPTALATAEGHQESHPVTEEDSPPKPGKRLMQARLLV